MNTYHLKTYNRDNFMCFIIENYEYIKPFDFDTDFCDIDGNYYFILSINSKKNSSVLYKLISKHNITII